ncbi:hypothetical protein MPH_07746 [Macrophomina phaseolina MS6]|uniref:Uncharacterized protein n=2 Tax=Macrophomina phaseolina TaxID=35725 RepID=K2RK95_MACPH|nr:hypothetical protein MPH_07746 [Macrophomina phaseolina MS6]
MTSANTTSTNNTNAYPPANMAHRTLTQSTTSTQASLEPASPDASSQTFCFNKPAPRSTPSAEHNFFGAIKEKIRERSRSRSRASRSRERSPMPPSRVSTSSSTSTSPSPSQQLRHVNSSSTTSSTLSRTPAANKRQSTDSSYSYYYGRHSNQWLFGGFSVRETVKGAYHHFRHDSH